MRDTKSDNFQNCKQQQVAYLYQFERFDQLTFCYEFSKLESLKFKTSVTGICNASFPYDTFEKLVGAIRSRPLARGAVRSSKTLNTIGRFEASATRFVFREFVI